MLGRHHAHGCIASIRLARTWPAARGSWAEQHTQCRHSRGLGRRCAAHRGHSSGPGCGSGSRAARHLCAANLQVGFAGSIEKCVGQASRQGSLISEYVLPSVEGVLLDMLGHLLWLGSSLSVLCADSTINSPAVLSMSTSWLVARPKETWHMRTAYDAASCTSHC